MRFVTASFVCAAILVLSFFLNPILQSKGVPMGGLMMIAISALLAAAWMVITKGIKPKPGQRGTAQARNGD